MNLDIIENLRTDDLLEMYEDVVEIGLWTHCICKSKASGANDTLCYHNPSKDNGGCCAPSDGFDLQGCRNWCNANCGIDTWANAWGYYACYWNYCTK